MLDISIVFPSIFSYTCSRYCPPPPLYGWPIKVTLRSPVTSMVFFANFSSPNLTMGVCRSLLSTINPSDTTQLHVLKY